MINAEPVVLVEQTEDGVAIVKLNRPKQRNSLNLNLMTTLAATLQKLNKQKDVKCIILTGVGKNFCAGVDLLDAKAVFNGPVFRLTSSFSLSSLCCMLYVVYCICKYSLLYTYILID